MTTGSTRRSEAAVAPAERRGSVAVIDIGSNSLRLVVYDGMRRAARMLLNEKVLCGLGRGLSETGRLNPEGVELARVNLQRFVALARAIGVARLDVLATAAVRDAADGKDFAADLERRELEEPVGVIGHHHLDGSSEQLLADLVELGLVDRAGILLPAGRSRALRARSTCTTSIRRRFGCGRGTVDLVLSVRCPQAAHRRGSYRLMLVAKRYGVLIELVEPMI